MFSRVLKKYFYLKVQQVNQGNHYKFWLDVLCMELNI